MEKTRAREKQTQKRLKLKAAQRDNRRYLLIKASDDEAEKAILDYLGVLGMAKSAYIKVKESSKETVGAVLRESLNDVRAAFALANLSVVRVSGTIKGLRL